MTKSAVSCGFGLIEEVLNGKLHFCAVQWMFLKAKNTFFHRCSKEYLFWKTHFEILNMNQLWVIFFPIEIFLDDCNPFHNYQMILKIDLTAQKMKFSIKDFLSKCDQIRGFQRIWSHLLKKSLMENFIFLCSVFKIEI